MTEGFYKTDTFKTSNDDTWTTPRDYYNKVNVEFRFTLDAAALESSTLVLDNWYGPDHPDESRRDAFTRDWAKDSAGAIWLNPPYGRTIKDWVRKANAVANGGGQSCVYYQLVPIPLGGTITAYITRLDLYVVA